MAAREHTRDNEHNDNDDNGDGDGAKEGRGNGSGKGEGGKGKGRRGTGTGKGGDGDGRMRQEVRASARDVMRIARERAAKAGDAERRLSINGCLRERFTYAWWAFYLNKGTLL